MFEGSDHPRASSAPRRVWRCARAIARLPLRGLLYVPSICRRFLKIDFYADVSIIFRFEIRINLVCARSCSNLQNINLVSH